MLTVKGRNKMEDKTIKLVAIGIVAVLCIAGAAFVLTSNNDNEDEEITLTFGMSAGSHPMIYAWKGGLFEAEGVNVKVYEATTSSDSVAAFLAGKADMTFISPDPVFSVMDESTISAKMLANSRLPGISSMHVLYNTTSEAHLWVDNSILVDQIDPVDGVTVISSEIGLINFLVQAVDTDGKVIEKIALQTGSYESAWKGYVKMLYEGGTAYGVTYPAGQITKAQYDKLIDTTDENLYMTHPSSYSFVGDAVRQGKAIFGIGSNAGMSTAINAAETEDDPVQGYEMMSTPSLVDSGFATVLATDKAIETKYDQIIKVMRAIDKASALMADQSTAHVAATVVVPFLYPTATPDQIPKYIQDALDYYKDVRWDICFVEDTPDVFAVTGEIAGLFQENNAFSRTLFDNAFNTIYDIDLIKKMMKDVHMDDSGNSWWRLGTYEYKF